jgi:hypothetical protein
MQAHKSTTGGTLADLRIDGARRWDSFTQLAQIDATDKGACAGSCWFAADLLAEVQRGAGTPGFSSMDVISGAGHDTVYRARVAPAAMIFTPCKGGISHNEIEDARADHLEAGCNVLLQAMLNAVQTAGSVEA